MVEAFLLGGFYLAAGGSLLLFARTLTASFIRGRTFEHGTTHAVARNRSTARGYDSPDLYEEDSRLRAQLREGKETDD